MLAEIPSKYDRFMGALFFRPVARLLVSVVNLNGAVLDIGCGTGLVCEELVRTKPVLKPIGVDPSASMLRLAQSKGLGLSWVRGAAEQLPFRAEVFECLLSSFSLMFVRDRDRALREALRVIEPGGHFWTVVWGRLEENGVASVANSVARNFYRDDPPPFFEVPFSLSGETVAGELGAVGFQSVDLREVRLQCDAISPDDAAIGLLEGNPILTRILERGPERLQLLRERVATVLKEQFGCPIAANFTIDIVRGQRP